MNNTQRIALLSLVAAVGAALVTFGVLGGEQSTALQTVAVTAITLAAAIFIKPTN